jgi:quercetin dioxygenase-like cupin family protein
MDSAEETLIVLEGVVEATVGQESSTVGSGGMIVVPALEPDAVANVGDGLARVVGLFRARPSSRSSLRR